MFLTKAYSSFQVIDSAGVIHAEFDASLKTVQLKGVSTDGQVWSLFYASELTKAPVLTVEIPVLSSEAVAEAFRLSARK
jgi:hypothetical protein